MKKYYIAYGSNLNIDQMEYRCPKARPIGTAMLKDWELLFRGSKTGAYLTIGRKKGAEVPVAVWEVYPIDIEKLDIYEGYPRFYYKKDIVVECKDLNTDEVRMLDAFVYIMHEDRPYGIPSDYYVGACLDGYEEFGFDTKYLWEAVVKTRRLVG